MGTITNCLKKNKNVNTLKYKSTKISRKASQDITIDKEFNTKNKLSYIDEMHNMGLPCSFSSSKGQAHPSLEVKKIKNVRHGRQYMNRRGGFNRPLPAERTGIKLNDF